jgi:hypothetical protein
MKHLIEIINTDNEPNILKNNIVFEPSNVHQGHYVILNGEDTGIVVNLYFYKTNEDYKKEIDNKITQFNN